MSQQQEVDIASPSPVYRPYMYDNGEAPPKTLYLAKTEAGYVDRNRIHLGIEIEDCLTVLE